jgi:hypothetical protein
MTTKEPARSEQTKYLPNPVSALENQCEREILFQLGDRWVNCEGTAAQLEAEGIVPDETAWPNGFRIVNWSVDVLNFSLQRVRPDGAKGPRKDFVDIDWWCVHWTSHSMISFAQQEVARKAKALTDAVYRHSKRGQAEWHAHWERICAAREDKQFQAFKTLIPGLTRPRRGRKAKSQEASRG